MNHDLHNVELPEGPKSAIPFRGLALQRQLLAWHHVVIKAGKGIPQIE
jgi:hypothetical protein